MKQQEYTGFLPQSFHLFIKKCTRKLLGLAVMAMGGTILVILWSYNVLDPSFNIASSRPVENLLGMVGAYISDILYTTLGVSPYILALIPLCWGYKIAQNQPLHHWHWRLCALPFLILTCSTLLYLCLDNTDIVSRDFISHYGISGYIGLTIGQYIDQQYHHLLIPLFSEHYQLIILSVGYWFTIMMIACLFMIVIHWLCYIQLGLYQKTGQMIFHSISYIFGYMMPSKKNSPLLADEGQKPSDSNIIDDPSPHISQDTLSPQDLLHQSKHQLSYHSLTQLSVIKQKMTAFLRAYPSKEKHDAVPDNTMALSQDFIGEASPLWQYDQPQVEQEQYLQVGQAQHTESYPEYKQETISSYSQDTSNIPISQEPITTTKRTSITKEHIQHTSQEPNDYIFPPTTLLSPTPEAKEDINQETLNENALLLEETLKDFGVKGQITHISPGPVVTLYELEPAPGTKTSRIIGLSDDIARSMSALSVRIATIPGRSVIGIEMPNVKRESVYFRELLESKNFQQGRYKLPVILGKDIGGGAQIADLASMPHLLIAGTTGSGKSVGLNAMILSLLYRYKPQDCRFIMIDPKMLELSVYDKIPHLLTPVVTDPKKAIVALKWAVLQMEERYKAMSKMGVRNIEGYNNRINEAIEKGETLTKSIQVGFDKETNEPIYEHEEFETKTYPFIVIVVDEMADLMLVAGKEIEASIQRLAQMARAAGIHLIMATQRPSVDVITGTIKANFPTRISFMVTSKIDSRTILGEQGAEQLLGKGDMLYMAPGGRISRIHGPFVEDNEVEKICNHLRMQGVPEYVEGVTDDKESDEMAQYELENAHSGDEIYDKAVALVAKEGKASTSFIQRHLQIGYNRAARIIEQMEKDNIVSSANHVGKRDVLIGEHAA